MKAIVLIVVAIWLICGIVGSCMQKSKTQPSGSSSPTESVSHNITRADVIRETQKALELAQGASGVKATGFTVDECVIGDTSASCHFHCYVNGVRHVGGIGFNISGGRLEPSGQYYLDPDR